MNKTKTIKNSFDRKSFLEQARNQQTVWDILIIGGGATGLGVALDAASRGLKTLLLEQADFSSGTSSRSTKLAHGGVRYLAQGNIGLVKEALQERGLMLKNAPHLAKMLPFIIPGYRWWEKYFYGAGLKIYDLLAQKARLGKTVLLSSDEVLKLLPDIRKKGLSGGVLYFDAQFDDSRLAINLAQTSTQKGASLLNYVKVTSLQKNKNGKVSGVQALDVLTKEEFKISSRVVINATGVFVDDILKMNAVTKRPLVKVSQGIHLVLDKSFLKGEHAMMIPATSDGRLLFALPWHDHLLVGTTDTPLDSPSVEPVALDSEIDFVLKNLENHLQRNPTRKDILSVFAGLRPLVVRGREKGTKEISRDHKLKTSASDLITITGGKWTTYRKMAEDTVNQALKVAGMEHRECLTSDLRIHGHSTISNPNPLSHLNFYGSDAREISALAEGHPELKEKLHPALPHMLAEVIWIVRNEMAQTIEDVLGRRLRVLFLNSKAAIEMAPKVAEVLAEELHKDTQWKEKEIKKFISVAQNYLAESYLPTLKTEDPTPTKVKI